MHKPPHPVYALDHLTQSYNGRSVLHVDQLTIQSGEIFALVGPSGAGKSTLLRLLSFLEMPASGTLHFQGQRRSAQWPDLAARRKVTMVFQRPQLLRKSVRQNVAYGLQIRGKNAMDERVTAVLEQVGLAQLAEAKAHTLSGGEMQRVALARALILQPEVLLLDEPTANLDPANIRIIEQIVQQVNAQNQTTVITVTHNIFQAQRLADRVGFLLNGRLVEVAPNDIFFNHPQQPETSAFLNGDMIY